jgi:diguanylate cyclase (GGDEF)-like protein
MPAERPILIHASVAPPPWAHRAFVDAGYQVISASNGLVALDQATRTPPDLLIADAELPGLGGAEIGRILKGLPSLPPIPVVLVEASLDEVYARGAASGADDVWVTPSCPLELRARLDLLQARLQAIAQLRAERDRLWALAHEDHLTGLPNRRRLDQALADALADMRARGSVLSVLLFDVDRFKDLNDRFGHATGDRVLREIAEVLRGNSRRQDVVGRFGGEEFLYLLPGHHLDEAVSQAERIRSELARHSFSTQNGEASLTVSVGATEASPDDRPEDVLERADRLLYQAKRSGRNRIVSLVS